MEKSVVLGIDIGGTNTIYGYITRDGTIIFHDEIPTNGAKPISDLIGRISDNVKEFFSKNQGYSLNGIGIGAPNGNHYTGMIQSPPNLSWGNIDIVSLFSEKINCKTLLTNDANAAAASGSGSEQPKPTGTTRKEKGGCAYRSLYRSHLHYRFPRGPMWPRASHHRQHTTTTRHSLPSLIAHHCFMASCTFCPLVRSHILRSRSLVLLH